MRKDLRQPVPKTQSHTVESVVAIAKHPIHPMLVTFPIAFLSMVVVTDGLYLWLRVPFWAELAFWLNVGGLGFGVLAGIVGTMDMMSIRVVRRHVSAWNHFIVAVMVLAMAALGVWLRLPDPVAAVWPWGLLSSAVMALLVAVAGWLGGTLSFRHGVGVYGDEEAQTPKDRDREKTPPTE
ncbi:DUF2231 domain-containing protein [Luteimonas sp. S4-F44]|uniref:DUF2231 domain-containing protein n=1 Tax=Luteimonas sp. S4-F44 TaxID=2925842 RepID=UPI001F53A8FE|nr:DUF2231 domain-containing protein [Luteimonas sp. S4-F44]UNK42747.1 DUF2231 domain-containing protein [Luteimonas sp. S4-F44]